MRDPMKKGTETKPVASNRRDWDPIASEIRVIRDSMANRTLVLNSHMEAGLIGG
jgi:hypothetical protein